MKTIYFVRHAESESNVNGLLSGQGNDVVLTDNGRSQARQAGDSLKRKGIEVIVSSPLQRTMETATIIAEQIGYDPKNIVTSPLWVERSYGVYEGRPGQLYVDDVANGIVHESVESTEEMHIRFKRALEWLRTLDADTILVVSHGGASRAVRVINEDLHHSKMYELEAFDNAGIYEFSL